MFLLQKFFLWLDERRDKKLQRTITLMQAQQTALNEPLTKALDALSSHTALMNSWLDGFQNLSREAPFTSTVRDEDELKAEKARIQNIDGFSPLLPEWQKDAALYSTLDAFLDGRQ